MAIRYLSRSVVLGLSVGLLMASAGEAVAQGGPKTYVLTIHMSGRYNGQVLPATTFLVPIVEVSDDPLSDLVITGVLPSPSTVFPGAGIDDLAWAKMNTPYQSYIAGLDCLDDTCPNICSCLLCPNCKGDGLSPDGIDEVFSIAFSNGDLMQGISDIDNVSKIVVYQINANLSPPVAGAESGGEGGVLFSETAEFNFAPTSRAGDPVEASGSMTAGAVTGEFDGLVAMKTEGAVWPTELAMSKTLTYQVDLSFELRFDFAPGHDCSLSDINNDNNVGIVDFLRLLFDWGPCL
jgi:hypothetical protein